MHGSEPSKEAADDEERFLRGSRCSGEECGNASGDASPFGILGRNRGSWLRASAMHCSKARRLADATLATPYNLRPLELGSDHQVFEAFGVPMVYFHDWPDVTIHTNKDLPENLDATKLGRVAYGEALELQRSPFTPSGARGEQPQRRGHDE